MDEVVRSSEAMQLSQGKALAPEEIQPESPAGSRTETVKRVRVNFRVASTVNPLLAEDLMRFTPGKSRHARLLTLVTLGLLIEAEMLSGATPQQNPADVNSEPDENRNLKVLGRGGGY